jgi:hypothetical protein
MKPPLIPPMACDLVQTVLSSFDGVEFTRAPRCPACGGTVQGYDTRAKKFAVLREGDRERTISVMVKRFTCRTCGTLCYAEDPFYPDTRIGSPVIDLCRTLSATRPYSRTARVLDAMDIIVDRASCRNYATLPLPVLPTADVFGLQLPFSIISLSSLAARLDEGCRIEGAEALAACGFPSAYRAPADRALPVQERDERDEQEEEEERDPDHP